VVTVAWHVEGMILVKEFVFSSFAEAVRFVNRIVPVADDMDHHPDVVIHSYRKVTIQLTTHSTNTITEKDYMLAKKIDALFK
jgi:4a-hydroxytetrahydrobiopterin dehydratase